MSMLSIQCPACGRSCELAFEQPQDVVALVCPACEAALVHYHGQTFRIDAAELRYLRSRGHVREARAWIRDGGADPTRDDPGAVGSRPDRREAIDETDIANLRRDLDACSSVEEFLKLLG